MSLTSLLGKNTEVKSVLKDISPSKAFFKSNTSYLAFSSKNPMVVPYRLECNGDAGLVGTAADYMFRFIAARTLNHDKDAALEGLVSERALNSLSVLDKSEFSKRVQNVFNDGTRTIRRYIYGEDISLTTLAEISLHLAYLDSYYRSEVLPNEKSDIIDRVDPIVINDIVELSRVFMSVFVDTHIITPDSDIEFNPAFGYWSAMCGGADADIYIDGVLYDFKCTKTLYKDWTEIGQLFGYYLLQRLCFEDKTDDKHKWIKKPIKAIAIYKGRFGLINKCVVAESDADVSADALNRFRTAIQNENEKQSQNQSAVMTTSTSHRNIPLSAFIYKKGDIVYNGWLSKAIIQDPYLADDGYHYVVKCEDTEKLVQGRLIDFYNGYCLICQNEVVAEGKHILHKKYGFGKVLKIEKHGSLTEMHVKFERKGIKVLNLENEDFFVAKKYAPVFKSSSEFPYNLGDEVVFGNSTPVRICGFKKEDNVLFVYLRQKDGKEERFPLGIAAMFLCDELPRRDIQFIDMATRNHVSLEQLSLGQNIEYINSALKDKTTHLTGCVSEITHDEQDVLIVRIDFGNDGIKSFKGKRFRFK